jgi:kojibiose phosphorylase
MPSIYQRISDWEVGEVPYNPNENLYFETNFTLGNGYMAARGMLDEGFGGEAVSTIPGFYVAGIFDHYEDGLYELVSQPNIFACRIFIDGEELSLRKGGLCNYSRVLDMRRGVLTRGFEWECSGRKTRVEILRFVSMANVHLAAARYKLTPINYDGNIRIESYLDKRVGNIDWGRRGTFELSPARHLHFEIIEEGHGGTGRFQLGTRTRTSRLETAESIEVSLRTPSGAVVRCETVGNDSEIGNAMCFEVRAGGEYVVEKKIAVFTSRDEACSFPVVSATGLLDTLAEKQFEELLAEHVVAWDKKWKACDIEIEGNSGDQTAVRFNVFHLIQACAENDPFVSIGGRLLGSEVFNGGVFWDTEMFVLPFYLYTNPGAARRLIMYRYNTLHRAREKAKKHWFRGAMFAATSVDDGREQCAFWEYANAEVHFNADIAYAVCQYYEATGDEEFLVQEGLELLIETARFWESRFFYDKAGDRYHLMLVQGPDEYTGPVNNDTYTLVMAKLNLEKAVEAINLCKSKYPEKWRSVRGKLEFDDQELVAWVRVAEKAFDDYYDEERKLYVSDEMFLRRIPIDPFAIKDPLVMLRFTMPSYDTLLRHQIVKQPSILLMMYLLPERFSPEEKRANWEFYEPKTIYGHNKRLPC